MDVWYKARNLKKPTPEYLTETELLKAYPELDVYLLTLDTLSNVKIFRNNETIIIER